MYHTDTKLDRFSPYLLVELWVEKNIGRDAVEPNILKLITRPINIGRKSSNFVIIMRRVRYYHVSDSSEHDNRTVEVISIKPWQKKKEERKKKRKQDKTLPLVAAG